MIEWMQKHKKWLIVTIWISTIAFVGAGFVGWGSYDYGKSDSTVATVGKKEIPLKDLQAEYSNLYSQYQQMLGENFNQEMAQQFKLEEAALQRVIQRYLILNYADEIKLMVTDQEVAIELLKINAFFKDGKFDKNTYIAVLRQNKRTATEFESQLKQDILVTKVQNLFQTSLQTNELENISNLIFSEDEVSINIVTDNDIKINATEEQLKEYWNQNKQNYKSESGYEILYTKIKQIEEKTKKEMRKVALRAYLDLKKENESFQNNTTLYTSSDFLTPEDFKTLITSKEGTVLKPMYKDDHYYVIKLVKKVLPQELAYKKVQDKVKTDYTLSMKANLLNEKAQEVVSNFSGQSIGYIGRNNIPTIEGLIDLERDEFIKHLFSADKVLNSVNLGSKIVVYKITNSRFAQNDAIRNQTISQTIQNLKTSSLSSSLLAKLASKYEVKSFMGNE